MDLISILWMAAGVVGLIFSIDALLTRFVVSRHTRTSIPSRLTAFGVMMLVISIGCFIIFAYEITT